MKILLVDQFGELGGAQRGMIEAASGLVARGAEIYAAIPHGPVVAKLAPLAREIVPFPCGPFQSQRKTAADVLRFAAQLPAQLATISNLARDVDLVYVHGPRAAPAAALARTGKPLVFHAHSIVSQRSAARLLARSLGSFQGLLSVGPFVARWLESYGRTAQVIYNGVADLPVRDRKRGECTRIGILGRISPEKGQLAFVRAARIARQQKPVLEFLVAGGPMFGGESYERTVRGEAGPEVHFLPWTEDIAGFFGSIDLLVVASTDLEACPRVVLEGFAAGVPVLGTACGGIPDLIDHNRNGLLADPEQLAEAILDATSDPARLHKMARNARNDYERRFTLARYQSEVSEALEAVLRATVARSARA